MKCEHAKLREKIIKSSMLHRNWEGCEECQRCVSFHWIPQWEKPKEPSVERKCGCEKYDCGKGGLTYLCSCECHGEPKCERCQDRKFTVHGLHCGCVLAPKPREERGLEDAGTIQELMEILEKKNKIIREFITNYFR